MAREWPGLLLWASALGLEITRPVDVPGSAVIHTRGLDDVLVTVVSYLQDPALADEVVRSAVEGAIRALKGSAT
jgi:hypothetical protein